MHGHSVLCTVLHSAGSCSLWKAAHKERAQVLSPFASMDPMPYQKQAMFVFETCFVFMFCFAFIIMSAFVCYVRFAARYVLFYVVLFCCDVIIFCFVTFILFYHYH